MSEGTPMPVTYKDLGGQIVGVNFVGGGGIIILVTGPNSATMDFPGMGAHKLARVGR